MCKRSDSPRGLAPARAAAWGGSTSSASGSLKRVVSRGTHSSNWADQDLKPTLTCSALASLISAAHQAPDHSTRNFVPTSKASGSGRAVVGSFVIGRKCFKRSYCSSALKGRCNGCRPAGRLGPSAGAQVGCTLGWPLADGAGAGGRPAGGAPIGGPGGGGPRDGGPGGGGNVATSAFDRRDGSSACAKAARGRLATSRAARLAAGSLKRKERNIARWRLAPCGLNGGKWHGPAAAVSQ